MLIFRHCLLVLVLFFILGINISFAADHPKALIVEHGGDTYAGDYTSPDGDFAPAKERHKEGYTGTYIYEGEFNGSPYWVQNGCVGEFVIKECRCYIYKQNNRWVLVPQPPGTSGKLYGRTDDWLANAYNDNKWPWEGKWAGNVKSITINNDIDLNKAREEVKINSCPGDKKEPLLRKPEEQEAQGWIRGKIKELTMKAKFWVKAPVALYIKHGGDEYGGDMIRGGKGGPLGDEPAGYRHAGDYTGTYILEGKFNGSPYWVQNNCVGGGDACRCYIYKQRDLWVLVPQHPGAFDNAWLANAYTEAEFPWKDPHKWRGEVDFLYISEIDPDLEYKKRVALDSCPGEWPPGYKDKNPAKKPQNPTQVDYSGTTNTKKTLSDGTDATVTSRDNGEDVLAKIENQDPHTTNADGTYTSSANSAIGTVEENSIGTDDRNHPDDGLFKKGVIRTNSVLGVMEEEPHLTKVPMNSNNYLGQLEHGDMNGVGISASSGASDRGLTYTQGKFIGEYENGKKNGWGAELTRTPDRSQKAIFIDGIPSTKNSLFIGNFRDGKRHDGELFRLPNYPEAVVIDGRKSAGKAGWGPKEAYYLSFVGLDFSAVGKEVGDRKEVSLFYMDNSWVDCRQSKPYSGADCRRFLKPAIKSKIDDVRAVFLKAYEAGIKVNDSAQRAGSPILEYKGAFKNGLKHGLGEMWYEDTSSYSGTFINGFAEGQGRKFLKDGARVHGSFKKGKPHGKATLESIDGSIYYGIFVNGIANGEGKKTFADKTSYTGQFKNGVANGYGTFRDTAGRKLTGEWKNGKFNKKI